MLDQDVNSSFWIKKSTYHHEAKKNSQQWYQNIEISYSMLSILTQHLFLFYSMLSILTQHLFLFHVALAPRSADGLAADDVDVLSSSSSSSWAKRSGVASRRCDLPPKRSVPSQLESISHWYSHVPVDLMDPCGERSTSSTPPVGWWPDTVLSSATGLEDLVCWRTIRCQIITVDFCSAANCQNRRKNCLC